ncbi:MAG: hypothetical protein A3D44_03980 [Candidatus Staskawiczbacteria bacterium RIFCSPHIGHO2_02_FULL_42_22]|uniref:Fumarate lyase N-terminal domain-containing protein n=1 Tax=Candidatus Staskawiczbacteria bacterium RIFCSPHIGHO2_02_FULL_42_22 TaxID=1802207 RepID=A0A1G2I1H8_9BACT|nr:MAG: hypothetical protein A3D44_03980 [Candidatus Staskawiczbacteria bacterium RIFCSPHIGHO2_02_FULL_42_22]
MHPRYAHPQITNIWSSENKLNLWQETELAVIRARVNLGQLPKSVFENISRLLGAEKIDLAWWQQKDKEVGHDLNAFLEERLRYLPIELQQHFHDGMTSYDTEESAFVTMLSQSLFLFEAPLEELVKVLKTMALRYRYTIMIGRTHGQEAELQSFGKRCLTWLVALKEGVKNLTHAKENLKYSKLSGAIGNYHGINAATEKEALWLLGFLPFYGTTQILPRELYVPLAQALTQIVMTISKMALDIRLGARSGRPIYQEPFGKKQKGSSAMPGKKNTIATEQLEGMARMAKGYCRMIEENIVTWEERAIEQSCVERVAWPDLFHAALHSVKTITRVLEGLQVYPDNMMQEIIDSCGCWAAGQAKEFLRHQGAPYGLSSEDAYRIVQSAAFNAREPVEWRKNMRKEICASFEKADSEFFHRRSQKEPTSIQDIISRCLLVVSSELAASPECIKRWHQLLEKIFSGKPDVQDAWCQIFKPSHSLRGEAILYKQILGYD